MKLDENLGHRGALELRAAGHDVATVFEQQMSSASDSAIIDVCRQEQRALVTLDMDFANPLHFRPREYSGVAVLRLPDRPSYQHLIKAVHTLISALKDRSLDGKLWIVEIERMREYQDPQEEESPEGR